MKKMNFRKKTNNIARRDISKVSSKSIHKINNEKNSLILQKFSSNSKTTSIMILNNSESKIAEMIYTIKTDLKAKGFLGVDSTHYKFTSDNNRLLFYLYNKMSINLYRNLEFISFYQKKNYMSYTINNIEYYLYDNYIFSRDTTLIHKQLGYNIIPPRKYEPESFMKKSLPAIIQKFKPKYIKLPNIYSEFNSHLANMIDQLPTNNDIECLEFNYFFEQATCSYLINHESFWKKFLVDDILYVIKNVKNVNTVCLDVVLDYDMHHDLERINGYWTNAKNILCEYSGYEIIFKISHYDKAKQYIITFIENRIGGNIKEGVKTLLYCKYSKSSPIRKLHRFVLNKIKGFFSSRDSYEYNQIKDRVVLTK